MPLEPRDAAHLWDIVETGRTIAEFTAGVAVHSYLSDRKLQMAIERAVEIIGEAARHLSDSFKTDHPEIPWRRIVAQRHVIAHEYGDIKQERLWSLATRDVPLLVAQLEPSLPPRPAE
jgi:uncharacterized protein with HEPN domain